MTVAERIEEEVEDQPVVLEDISWRTFMSFARDLEDSGQHKRLTYDRGRMAIVSPLPIHEKWKSLLGRFVEAIADERGITISTFGQTLWKRKDLKRGLEPDECFYIQHEPQMRGKRKIDLLVDPPPDLCIEIDLRRTPMDKRAVYAALGIPELWHFEKETLEVLALGSHEIYSRSDYSVAMPFLRPADLKQFVEKYGQMDQGSLVRRVRDWAKKLPE